MGAFGLLFTHVSFHFRPTFPFMSTYYHHATTWFPTRAFHSTMSLRIKQLIAKHIKLKITIRFKSYKSKLNQILKFKLCIKTIDFNYLPKTHLIYFNIWKFTWDLYTTSARLYCLTNFCALEMISYKNPLKFYLLSGLLLGEILCNSKWSQEINIHICIYIGISHAHFFYYQCIPIKIYKL